MHMRFDECESTPNTIERHVCHTQMRWHVHKMQSMCRQLLVACRTARQPYSNVILIQRLTLYE